MPPLPPHDKNITVSSRPIIIYSTVELWSFYACNPFHLYAFFFGQGIYNTDYGKTVTADDRNGDAALNTSLNGTNSKNYYRAPSTFFVADEGVGDSADTSGGIMSVLDPSGEMHSVVASGTRAILAEIPEVGFLRTRYPIMPTHVGGSATWKEIEALKDMFLNPNKYRKMYYYDEFDKPEPEIQIVKTNVASVNDSHIHYLIVTRRNVDNMNADEAFDIPINTSVTDGHFHTMNVYRNTNGVFRSRLCDGKFNCPGGHERKLLCDPEDDCMDYPELAWNTRLIRFRWISLLILNRSDEIVYCTLNLSKAPSERIA